jgi:hypothetical protein
MGRGCGRRAGTERVLCLCFGGGREGQVGGVGNWLGERVGRVGVRLGVDHAGREESCFTDPR